MSIESDFKEMAQGTDYYARQARRAMDPELGDANRKAAFQAVQRKLARMERFAKRAKPSASLSAEASAPAPVNIVATGGAGIQATSLGNQIALRLTDTNMGSDVKPSPNGSGSGTDDEGEWYSLTLCDNTTLKVKAKDIVAGGA